MRSSVFAVFGLATLLGCGETPQVDPEQPAAVSTPTPAAARPGPTASGRLTVAFTNNIDGEIEPCG